MTVRLFTLRDTFALLDEMRKYPPEDQGRLYDELVRNFLEAMAQGNVALYEVASIAGEIHRGSPA